MLGRCADVVLPLAPWPLSAPQSVKDMPIVQDGPPPGGFPAVRYARRVPSTGPSGFTLFAGALPSHSHTLPCPAQGCCHPGVCCCATTLRRVRAQPRKPACEPPHSKLTALLPASVSLPAPQWARRSWPTASIRWASPTARGAPRSTSTMAPAQRWCPSCRFVAGAGCVESVWL